MRSIIKHVGWISIFTLVSLIIPTMLVNAILTDYTSSPKGNSFRLAYHTYSNLEFNNDYKFTNSFAISIFGDDIQEVTNVNLSMILEDSNKIRTYTYNVSVQKLTNEIISETNQIIVKYTYNVPDYESLRNIKVIKEIPETIILFFAVEFYEIGEYYSSGKIEVYRYPLNNEPKQDYFRWWYGLTILGIPIILLIQRSKKQ